MGGGKASSRRSKCSLPCTMSEERSRKNVAAIARCGRVAKECWGPKKRTPLPEMAGKAR